MNLTPEQADDVVEDFFRLLREGWTAQRAMMAAIVRHDMLREQMGLTDETLIEKADVSARLKNLSRFGEGFPKTVGEAKKMNDADLLRFPACGRKTLRQIREIAPYQGGDQ